MVQGISNRCKDLFKEKKDFGVMGTLNEHGDPQFLFYKFNENNILNNREKNWQKSMATFLANEINATERDITGPTKQVQII